MKAVALQLPKIAPLTLTRLRKPFDHPEWIFELKHDGFRGMAYVSDGQCQLVSRNGNVFRRFNQLCDSLGRLAAGISSAFFESLI